VNRIKELLEQYNWTQEELSFRSQVSQPQINRIANERTGTGNLQLRTAARIAKAFKKPVEYVFPDYFKN